MKYIGLLLLLSACSSGPTKPQPLPLPPGCSSTYVEPLQDEFVVQLKAANGQYVSADCGGGTDKAITANKSIAGEWETFYIKDGKIRTSHGLYLTAESGGGSKLSASRTQAGPWETFEIKGELNEGSEVGFRTSGGKYISARITLSPPLVTGEGVELGAWEKFSTHVLSAPITSYAREGIVHAQGRNFADDNGTFYPLGGTLFWALRGWKFDQERTKKNLDYLGKHSYDYVRILAEVGWAGNDIDPAWPDYEKVLGEFLDYAYDKCGLRTELTIIGGGHESQAQALVQKIINVVQTRKHKILNFEVANESYQRNLSLEQMRSLGKTLKQAFPQNLVALSSGEGAGTYQNTGDWRKDFTDVYMSQGANMGTIHMDRTFGDQGYRAIRQPWDWKDFGFPISHNEPIGPRSSVAEEMDPARLAMLRAVGLINGVEAFVLHNAAGVGGQPDSGHNRPANLWEVPGIDQIMETVRKVETYLPAHVADGTHYNNGWAGSPFNVDAFWNDSEGDHGVNRNYMVAYSDGWVSTLAGVKGYVNVTVLRNSEIDVYDVLLGKIKTVILTAGVPYKLESVSKDSRGFGNFIIRGRYKGSVQLPPSTTTTTSTSTTSTTIKPSDPPGQYFSLGKGGLFPALTYFNNAFYVAYQMGNEIIIQNLKTSQKGTYAIQDTIAFPKLSVWNNNLILIYRSGSNGVFNNVTLRTTEDLGPVAGNSPVMAENGYIAWQTLTTMKRRNLNTNQTESVGSIRPTGISRIKPEGSVVFIDDDRYAIPGYTLPCWNGTLAAAEGSAGGVATFLLNKNPVIYWPGTETFQPACSQGDGKSAVATWGSEGVKAVIF